MRQQATKGYVTHVFSPRGVSYSIVREYGRHEVSSI